MFMPQISCIKGLSETNLLGGAQAILPGSIGTEEEPRAKTHLTFDDGLVYGEEGPSDINYDIIARWVLQENFVVHLMETENTLIYRNGVYEDFAEAHLKKLLFDEAEHIETEDGGSLIRIGSIKEVLSRVCSWSLKSISSFECTQHVFNMSNGILNLDTFQIMPHSPAFMVLSKSPAIFNPEARCPMFQKFLDQSLEPKYHPVIAEIFGVCALATISYSQGTYIIGTKTHRQRYIDTSRRIPHW